MTSLANPIAAEWWRPDTPPAAAALPEAHASAVPFWALVALTAVMFLAPQTFIPALASLRIALLCALFAIAAYVVDRLRRRRPFFAAGPEMRWCLALAAWATVTVPFSMWPGGSMNLLLEMYFKSVIVFWLLGGIVQSRTRLRLLVWILSVLTVPLALTAVAHLASGDIYPPGASITGRIIGYDSGLARNPNDLALLLDVVLPLTAALALVERGRARRAVLAVVVAAQVGGVVATFSRAGFLGLLVTGGAYLWLIGRRPGSQWVWIGAALALLALPVAPLPGAYAERLGTILNKDADPTGSAQARWNDQVLAAGFVLDHPLVGAGAGMDVLALNDLRGPKWREVHDMYLEYAVDLGLPGLALFLVLFGKCFRAAGKSRAATGPQADLVSGLARGLRIGLTSFAVAAFFYPVAYQVYFYYLAGLAVAAQSSAGTVTA